MIKEILRTISIWIVVLPLVAGFINYKGLNKDSKWIFFLVITALVPQLLTFIIDKENFLLNTSYNIYTLIEFIVLYIIFKSKYRQSFNKSIVTATFIIYTIIAAILFTRDGLSQKFLNDLVCVNNVIYMIWILFFLKEQYSTKTTRIQRRSPFAWYLLAILIYAPCTVMVFSLYYYIREGNPILSNLWIIQSVCNILLYILFSVGLFIPRQSNTF